MGKAGVMSRRSLIYSSGDKYGSLTLTGKCFVIPQKSYRMVECICECGKIIWRKLTQIKSYVHASCGCMTRKMQQKGGFSYHPSFKVLDNMKSRCYNEKHDYYKNYGGRGIDIFDGWMKDAKSFVEWAIANGYKKGLTIERLDNDKGYYPNNCQWVTRKVQSHNTRQNVFIKAFNEVKCVAEWVADERCSVSRNTILHRIHKQQMSSELAISLPRQR